MLPNRLANKQCLTNTKQCFMFRPVTAIEKACKAAGGGANLARALGISSSAVSQWVKGSRPVPVDRMAAIERATGGVVTRRDLRPDDWAEVWPELAAEPVGG